jgi:hypothetical protein
MTKIVEDWPPNIAAIRKALPVTMDNIFAWDGTIYNPGGGKLGPALIAHEEVHFRQQAGQPDQWWKKYLESAEFRLDQEIEAHREEYRVFYDNHPSRNIRRRFLRALAKRLSAPMYGGLITERRAVKEIKGGGNWP